jgi:hypothetical protein
MASTETLTSLTWDWFTSVGRARVLDHDGVGGAADWHLLFACEIDKSSALPTPGLRPRTDTPMFGTVATGVACVCGHFTSETLFTPTLMPFADLVAAAEAEAATGSEVFVVTVPDTEGHAETIRVFATREVADEYAEQVERTDYTPGTADVDAYTVLTEAPTRVTNYMISAMYSTPRSAQSSRTLGEPPVRVRQFDTDDEARMSNTLDPVTTEPLVVAIEDAPSLWRIVKVYGTSETAVVKAFETACAQVVAEAKAAQG